MVFKMALLLVLEKKYENDFQEMIILMYLDSN